MSEGEKRIVVRGIYGRATPHNHPVAQQFPLGAAVNTPKGKALVGGYSTSAFAGITGLWVCDGPFLNQKTLKRFNLEEVTIDEEALPSLAV